MLNADTPMPAVRPKWGSYGKMFHDLLAAAAYRISPGVEIKSTDYDVQNFEYPQSLSEIDVILVTGSASSSYDNKEWIRRLDDYVLEVYLHHPRIKMFGSCFGHQLICESLLRGYGVRVEKDPRGWEIGVKEILLEEKFSKTLGRNLGSLLKPGCCTVIPDRMRVQFVHADHVKIPAMEALPPSWIMVGSTQHCAVQGVYEPGRVLTLQGHFEFNRWVNTEIMKVFGAGWDAEVLKQALEAVDMDDDAEKAAEMVLQFLLEKQGMGDSAAYTVVNGLLTPPLVE